MNIIIDALGGDNAPVEILKGAALAVKELGVNIIAVGDENKIKNAIKNNSIDSSGISIVHAADVFKMEDNPISIRHKGNETSMAIGLRLLKDGKGDAFVSAGSTGALVVGGTFIVKRIKGIKKTAIGSVMPGDNGPFMLMDSGANIDCTPKALKQFAVMGSMYMENVLGIKNPKVGLANIGTEENKGSQLYIDAFKVLKETPEINFIGNAEARDIPFTVADVVVADGFTGNIILKTYEGTALALLGNIKKVFTKGLLSKLSYLGVKKGMSDFKKKMDYKEYGGAALMGLTKPVIKAHGSSDAKAFKNAIRQAVQYSEKRIIDGFSNHISGESND
ncbi:MAG TPA: phosphate acyltransferase PlsX [Oscillospiraceae bacterium]|nr:phosphate acyltransferase PlsX [Oscillospiraceae bacterium]